MLPDRSSASTAPALGAATKFAVIGTSRTNPASGHSTRTVPEAASPPIPPAQVSHKKTSRVVGDAAIGTLLAAIAVPKLMRVEPPVRLGPEITRNVAASQPVIRAMTGRLDVLPSGHWLNTTFEVTSSTVRPGTPHAHAKQKFSRPEATSRITSSRSGLVGLNRLARCSIVNDSTREANGETRCRDHT